MKPTVGAKGFNRRLEWESKTIEFAFEFELEFELDFELDFELKIDLDI